MKVLMHSILNQIHKILFSQIYVENAIWVPMFNDERNYGKRELYLYQVF